MNQLLCLKLIALSTPVFSPQTNCIFAVMTLSASFAFAGNGDDSASKEREFQSIEQLKELKGRSVMLKTDLVFPYGINQANGQACATDSRIHDNDWHSELRMGPTESWMFSKGSRMYMEDVWVFSRSRFFEEGTPKGSILEIRFSFVGRNSEGLNKKVRLICNTYGKSYFSKADARALAVQLANQLFAP